MKTIYTILLLLLYTISSSSTDPASSFFTSFQSRVNWPLPSQHLPSFYVTRENITLLGSSGVYNFLVYAIRDASPPSVGGVVAAYIPAASENIEGWKQGSTPELNLLVPLPALAPQELPPLPRYGWSWLYGAKVVTIPWLDCCNITGDSSGYSFSEDYRSEWTLTQFQTWVPNGNHKGRDAQSLHTFTLRWDPTVGYRIDMVTSIVINAASAPKTIEFVNFLTPQLANPWPFPAAHDFLPNPRSSITTWSSDTGMNWKGFAENILAGAMLHTYNVSLVNSSSVGAVVMVANNGWSAALAFSGDGLTFLQATCPTWMDQHQIVLLPPPGPDGYIAASPTFSLAYLPSGASNDILSRVSVITHIGDGSRGNGSSVLLKIGVVEDFEDQPVELTTPLRALAQVWSSSDFTLVKNGGGQNGTSLAIRTLSPSEANQFYAFANSVPLIPLNVSTSYTFQANALAPSLEVCPPGYAAFAKLAVGIYEDDDFNTPTRLMWYNSTYAMGGEPWMNLSVSFISPPWPSYADIRFMSVESDNDHPCESNATALFDNVYFGEAINSMIS
jgi:hypothetical protein